MKPLDIDLHSLTPHPEGRPDLTLPAWGPYSKYGAGVSHQFRPGGMSLDFLLALHALGNAPVVPFFWDTEVRKPAGGFYCARAESRLRSFGFGFDLDGTGALTATADFSSTGPVCRAQVTFRNATHQPRKAALEILAVRPPECSSPPSLRLPPGMVWIDAAEYASVRTRSAHGYDGFPTFVEPVHDAIGSRVLGKNWAQEPGVRIEYGNYMPALSPTTVRLGIRYVKPAPESLPIYLAWGRMRRKLVFPVSQTFRWAWLDVPGPVRPKQTFALEIEGEAQDLPKTINGEPESLGFQIDGFVLDGEKRAPPAPTVIVPNREEPPFCTQPESGVFLFAGNGLHYGLSLPPSSTCCDQPGIGLFDGRVRTALPETAVRRGQWRIPPVHIPPSSTKTLAFFLAAHPEADWVRKALSPKGAEAGRSGTIDRGANDVRPEAGPDSLFARYPVGSRGMAAYCLMNVSYPVWLGQHRVAAHTPGKRWGGLYSWDAGMHGIGLLEVDPRAALECLGQYLCRPEDDQAFIWHGSPVPTQAYLWHEWFQRIRSREQAEWMYPRLRKFYRYLAGRTPGSPTDRFGQGLLNTFPLGYNSGGWDDLPPQVEVHRRGLTDQVTPVAPTAHAVRFARILLQTANFLGQCKDAADYRADIRRGVAALERTWDSRESVYSYVWHRDFRPFREPGGRNFNHTLDGMTPLFAGGMRPERRAVAWDRLRDKSRYATPVGLSTVDVTAPYFNPDGYWNGTVWIPYQWLLWKAALDDGQRDLALDIPRRAADAWEREAARTKQSGEYFRISTGRLGGYPHFAGLSAPILNLMAAVSVPGRVSVGFDTEIRAVASDGDDVTFEARRFLSGTEPIALVVMPRPGGCRIEAGGEPVCAETDSHGCVVVPLPGETDWRPVRVTSRSPSRTAPENGATVF